MTISCKQHIFLKEIPYYPSISHYIRCAFLFGEDMFSGHYYKHYRGRIAGMLKHQDKPLESVEPSDRIKSSVAHSELAPIMAL
ncbi:MAG: hypothetical protein P8163_10755 [Candidatus Thiodiazotropha sp.]